LSIPITAIGGITPENTVDVLTNGVSGIAVMSGIVSSSNPYSKAKSYKESIRKWAEKHV
ncbi:thiamine phosphate synthase, partial [Bacillus vallismortis]|nr:thiamine phosphate synthase [Bacillus vallismortis]